MKRAEHLAYFGAVFCLGLLTLAALAVVATAALTYLTP